MQRGEPARAHIPATDQPADAQQPRLASNASWRLAGTIVRVGIGLISVPIFTRVLGMSQWGLLALFQAAISPLALLDLGLGAATIKYAAESVGRGDREGATRVVHTTLLFNLAMGAVGVVALIVSARWLATSLFEIPTSEAGRAIVGFRLTAASWILGVISATYSAVLSAHQRYDVTSKLATVGVVSTTGCGLAVAAAGGDVVSVLLAQTVAAAAMAFMWFRAAAWLLPGIATLPKWDVGAFRRSFSFGVWEAVGTAGGLLAAWSDRYILGAFFVPAMVGFYAIVQMLYTHLYGAFLEMAEVLFPAVSHREGRGDLAGAQRLALLVGWTLTTGFGIAANVLAVVGGDFLHLWISPQAALEATTTLRLLCIGGIVGIAAVAPLYYLMGIGKTQWGAASSTAIGLTVIATGLVLVPRLGLTGVGYGLIIGVAIRWVFLAFIWRAHFRAEFRLGQFAAHVWAPPLVSVASLVLMTRLHDSLGRAPSWLWLFAEMTLALVLVATVHLVAGELLPGGSQRRHDVVSSFRPLLGHWTRR